MNETRISVVVYLAADSALRVTVDGLDSNFKHAARDAIGIVQQLGTKPASALRVRPVAITEVADAQIIRETT